MASSRHGDPKRRTGWTTTDRLNIVEPEPPALAGVQVIDLTQAMLGPSATQVLADFGADVIKIERPGSGDLMRWVLEDDPAGPDNPVYVSMNRNKRSITLDLRTDGGQQVIQQLIASTDVLVSNFRPAVMERLGLGEATLRERHPRLVYALGSGFGPSGPNAHKGGQDALAQAVSGVMARRSDPRHPLAVYATCLADYSAGMNLVQGILLALYARERTGRGQRIDVSLYDSMLAMQMQEASVSLMRQQELNWGGMPLTCVFETEDDPLVVVGAFRRDPLGDLCRALDLQDLSQEPRFATMAAMSRNVTELRSLLQDRFLQGSRSHWLKRLEAEDVLCAPVQSLEEALADPQTAHNGMVWELPRNDAEMARGIGSPVHLSQTPAQVRLPPPRLGEHRQEILGELGYDQEQLDDLERSGAFG